MFTWVALTGSFVFTNFFFVFAAGYLILWLLFQGTQVGSYYNRIPKIVNFIFFFMYELLIANLEIAWDLITPGYFMKPGIIKFELSAKTNIEITMLANLLSLTPGTLIIDVSDDKKVLYIHVMYLKDYDKTTRRIRHGYERRLLEILR